MDSLPADSPTVSHPSFSPLRAWLVGATRFWEPNRIGYNLVLVGILGTWFLATWPHFRGAMTALHLFQFFVLGVLANVCYSAAYLVDLPLQRVFGGAVLARWRWAIWVVGTMFAMLVESYWIADEIFPFVK
jgi:hypothetical protein